MLLALLVVSAVLLEAAQATHFTNPDDSPFGSAAHQGLRLSASLLPRLKNFAEKRHQSLLPYHPVVRFRGLGGPGEAWPDPDLFTTLTRPMGSAPSVSSELATAIDYLQQVSRAELDAEVRDALNAGDLLKALETLAKDGNSAKGIRFGIRR